MKEKHTPTPWTVKGRTIKAGEHLQQSINPFNGSVGTLKAHRVYFSVRNEADAEFIVRAVNSHEALLEAAKAMMIFLKKPMNLRAEADLKTIVVDLNTAIAIAEAKP